MSVHQLGSYFQYWLDDVLARRTYRRYGELADRDRRVRAQIAGATAIVGSVVYLAWITAVLDWTSWWISLPFLGGEVLGAAVFASFVVIAWHPRFHPPNGIPARRSPTVAVFVTVCREPLSVVEPTLRAAVNIEYRAKQVYVLDDGASDELRALAERIGCRYVARDERLDAKAGNLNHALRHTGEELILTLDADQCPDPAILDVLIGYFDTPRVGFVTTRQAFVVPPGDPFGNSDVLFYGVMQPGKNAHNAAFSCGSGVLYRRTALASVGGFSTWNLVEDFHTSKRLHAAGWRSVYHARALTLGTAPATISAVFRQRAQWATDSLRVFFWDSPFRDAGLTLLQKLHYAHVGFVYLFAGLVMPVFYILPPLALCTGWHAVDTSALEYLGFRVPVFVATQLAYQLFARVDQDFDVNRASGTWMGYFPAFMYAAAVALATPRRKPRYRVNAKVHHADSIPTRLKYTAVHLGLVTLSIVSIVVGFANPANTLDLWMINTLWALNNVAILRWVLCAAWATPA